MKPKKLKSYVCARAESYLNDSVGHMNGSKIVVTTNCPRCVKLRALLKKAGIEFVEKDLENADTIIDLVMRNIKVLSAPLLEIAGVVFEFRGE